MKHSKAVDRSLDGTALGRDLVDGKFLMPKRARLRDLLNSFLTITTGKFTSPSDLLPFFGVAQWLLLANRPMLSCCGSIYYSARADDGVEQRVPTSVLRELLLMASLLPALVQDLRLPWSPNVYATDGAQDYGYGGAKASCSPDLARYLASASRQDDVALILSDVADGMEANVCKVPLEFKDVKVEFSIPSKVREHACEFESGALSIFVQQLARSARTHRSRTFCLVDSQPLRFVIIKGRSSAPYFRFGSRRIAALLLAAEIQLYIGYTPSRSNPGDPPSRGLRPASHVRSAALRACSSVKRVTDYCHEVSRSHRKITCCGMAHRPLGSCRRGPSRAAPVLWGSRQRVRYSYRYIALGCYSHIRGLFIRMFRPLHLHA